MELQMIPARSELRVPVRLGRDPEGTVVMEGCVWMEDRFGVRVTPEVVDIGEGELWVCLLNLGTQPQWVFANQQIGIWSHMGPATGGVPD